MEHLYTALQFSKWSLEFLVFPPIRLPFLTAAISLLWAAIKQKPFTTGVWKPYHWLAACHFLFFVAAIAVGVFGENPVSNPTIPHPPIRSDEFYLDVVAYGSLVSCAFWIWRMKGFRWFATSLMAIAELITWGALFIAGMSVSGDWL
jgi:hypothetical protein